MDQHTALQQLLAAAQALLEARENQMVTRVEWEALQRAVTNATTVSTTISSATHDTPTR